MLSALIVTSCSTGIAEPINTSTFIPTENLFPSDTPTPNPTKTVTQTSYPTSTLTETTVPTQTATRTPNPTLKPEEAESLAVELLTTNTGCELPCWWGITPGETSWEEAEILLEQFDSEIYIPYSPEERKEFFFAQVTIPLPDEVYGSTMVHTYYVSNGIIEAIEVKPGKIDCHNLSTFLQTYGPPAAVRIDTYSTEYPAGVLPFLVTLFYPDRGILAVRGPEKASFLNNMVLGCQMDNPFVTYSLWDPNLEMSLQEVAKYFEKSFHSSLSLEEATNMDVEAFYKLYTSPGNATCIETPKNLWPPQQ